MEVDPRIALSKELHDLPPGWKWRWQDEVFDFQGGAQPPASTFVGSPRPGYVRLIQIRDYYTDSHLTFVPDSTKLRKCTADDVMIARYGSSVDSSSENSLGRICRGLKGAYNVALAKTIPASGIDRSFLFYLLKSDYFQAPLRAQGARSVQAGFNKASLRVIPLPIPPLEEQRTIAHILGTLDDKIELNRRMSETLEAMARALFESWFVDFEPVRAKAEGRELGLPPPLADLFPDSLEESELGEIPRGWKVSRLGEEAMTLLGGTPSRGEASYWGGDIPWINSGKANEFRVIEASEFITEAGMTSSATKRLPARTTVIAITGATLGQVSITEIATCANQSIVGVLGSPALPSEYIYFWVKENIEKLIASQTGGAQQHINKNNVNDLLTVLPGGGAASAYAQTARPIFDRIGLACFESRELATARKALLPKLVSGELRVCRAFGRPEGATK